MKRKINFKLLRIWGLIIVIIFSAINLSAQLKKPFSIYLNAGTFSLGVSDPPINNEITINFFLAPSLKYNRSELILGPLWSKREPYQYDEPKFKAGVLLGYKFHLLKEPTWFQFNFEYNAKLVHWAGKILNPDHNDSFYENWKITNLDQFFGYGMTLFLSREKNVYLFHSLGYGWTMRLKDSNMFNDSKQFNHLRYNAGLGIQIYNRQKKK